MSKNDDIDRFPTRKAAFDWVSVKGFKCSQGKFYSLVDAGKISMAPDGSLSKYAVWDYAETFLNAATGSAATGDLASEQLRKIKFEADLRELRVETERRRLNKLWLHADDAWASVAALIGVLRDAIRHELDSGKSLIIEKAEGDPYRAHEVFEAMEQLINKAFNEVAGDEIDVEFVREIDDEKSETPNQE
jgi:hypothetical protein